MLLQHEGIITDGGLAASANSVPYGTQDLGRE